MPAIAYRFRLLTMDVLAEALRAKKKRRPEPARSGLFCCLFIAAMRNPIGAGLHL
jgi:hypothetical protein